MYISCPTNLYINMIPKYLDVTYPRSPLRMDCIEHLAQLRLSGQLPVPLGTFIEYYPRFYWNTFI